MVTFGILAYRYYNVEANKQANNKKLFTRIYRALAACHSEAMKAQERTLCHMMFDKINGNLEEKQKYTLLALTTFSLEIRELEKLVIERHTKQTSGASPIRYQSTKATRTIDIISKIMLGNKNSEG